MCSNSSDRDRSNLHVPWSKWGIKTPPKSPCFFAISSSVQLYKMAQKQPSFQHKISGQSGFKKVDEVVQTLPLSSSFSDPTMSNSSSCTILSVSNVAEQNMSSAVSSEAKSTIHQKWYIYCFFLYWCPFHFAFAAIFRELDPIIGAHLSLHPCRSFFFLLRQALS